MRFNRPYCKRRIRCAENLAGRYAKYPGCNCEITVPRPELDAEVEPPPKPATEEHRACNTDPAPDSPDDRPSESADSIRRGRLIVISVIAYFLGLPLLGILNPGQLSSSNFVKLSLGIGLAVCVYKGLSWARLVLIGLLSLRAFMLLPTLLLSLAEFDRGWSFGYFFLGSYLLLCLLGDVTSVAAFLASPSVLRFMEHQQNASRGKLPPIISNDDPMMEWLSHLGILLTILSYCLTVGLFGYMFLGVGIRELQIHPHRNAAVGFAWLSFCYLIIWLSISVFSVVSIRAEQRVWA